MKPIATLSVLLSAIVLLAQCTGNGTRYTETNASGTTTGTVENEVAGDYSASDTDASDLDDAIAKAIKSNTGATSASGSIEVSSTGGCIIFYINGDGQNDLGDSYDNLEDDAAYVTSQAAEYEKWSSLTVDITYQMKGEADIATLGSIDLKYTAQACAKHK